MIISIYYTHSIPGYKHGCKVAVLDKQGNVLKTEVVYLQLSGSVTKKVFWFKLTTDRRFDRRFEIMFSTLYIT